MKVYKVLVVDDSAFMRKGISSVIEKDDTFEIIGVARNGKEAIEKVHMLKPDVVTMDVEMPEMNGIQALREIMKSMPTPVVMLSALTDEGTQATIEALELGAVDFYLKSNLLNQLTNEKVTRDFLDKLKMACQARVGRTQSFSKEVLAPSSSPQPSFTSRSNGSYELVIIGCSTGGPAALQKIITRIESDFPVPVVIVQHMPPGFTKPLSERLNRLCALHVKEAEPNEELKKGHIYIVPSGFQTTFMKTSSRTYAFRIHENYPKPVLYAPCVDVTLESASMMLQDKLLTSILTGMGNDGTSGCKSVKEHGGYVLTESEESCVVYGMPKSVVEAGYSDEQVFIENMYEQIKKKLQN